MHGSERLGEKSGEKLLKRLEVKKVFDNYKNKKSTIT